jgi:hypothetical protein
VQDENLALDNFTLDEYYEVFAIQCGGRAAFLTLIDDNDFLSTRLAYHFELESNEIPEDWTIDLGSDLMVMTLGPGFITSDPSVYDRMIDYDPEVGKKIQAYYAAKLN